MKYGATNRTKKAYLLIHEASGKTLAAEVGEANTFWRRGVGLIGKPRLEKSSGLRLTKTSSVHTFGMSFAIDLLFLDHSGICVGYKNNVPPNRIATGPKGASETVELAAGTLKNIEKLRVGDRFIWRGKIAAKDKN